jgi:hypothetical protein
MLEDVLRAVVPDEISAFPKLTGEDDYYFFQSWDRDRETGATLLRYKYMKQDGSREYRKRIFIPEVERLLEVAIAQGEIGRPDFQTYCPRTNTGGQCAFAVIVSVFRYLGIMRRTAWGVYSITNLENARQVLEE